MLRLSRIILVTDDVQLSVKFSREFVELSELLADGKNIYDIFNGYYSYISVIYLKVQFVLTVNIVQYFCVILKLRMINLLQRSGLKDIGGKVLLIQYDAC